MVDSKIWEVLGASQHRMALRWTEEVHRSPHMKVYQRFSQEELLRRSERLFERLVEWLKESMAKQEMGKVFVHLGKERYKENFPLCEVHYAFFLIKRVLWDFLLAENCFSDSLGLYKVMEAMERLNAFFDLIVFYTIRGYMEEMAQSLVKEKGWDDEEARKYFFPGSFYGVTSELFDREKRRHGGFQTER